MSDLERMKKVLSATALREMKRAEDWLQAGNGSEARKCFKFADRIMKAMTVVEEAEQWYIFKHPDESSK